MNDIIVHTNAPLDCLPNQAYDSAKEWYAALADMHMAQLTFQHHDAVEDEDDARDKYTARQLFRTLARDERLVSETESSNDDFLLFSEDFRPTNVLLDEDLQIVSVIDWEFAYAAPAQFSYDPPWWLLLEEPEYWDGGYEAWRQAYEPRLDTFLRVLQGEEEKLANNSNGIHNTDTMKDNADMSLSKRMRQRWDQGTWMVNYAARKSWAFDFIWWKYLDERYFGPNEDQDHTARLDCLSKSQREAMEAFVAEKMNDLQDGNTQGDQAELHDRLARMLI